MTWQKKIVWNEGRAFSDFRNWECWRAGMYNKCEAAKLNDLAELSRDLLACDDEFRPACYLVLEQWPISTCVHLTDKQTNRRAWLGQSACCLSIESPEESTRMGWWKLDTREQINANAIADEVIGQWELTTLARLYRTQSDQLEFPF